MALYSTLFGARGNRCCAPSIVSMVVGRRGWRNNSWRGVLAHDTHVGPHGEKEGQGGLYV